MDIGDMDREMDRDLRKEKRRRGTGKRDVDMEGFELAVLPELQLHVEEAERRVVEQHQKLSKERIRVRELEEDDNGKQNEKKSKVTRGRKKVGKKTSSMKIKYRRVPSNKVKLIYIDVIKMMIQDYLKDKNVGDLYMKRSGDLEKKFLKQYIERIDDYFSSLIDLRLSNSLMKKDLDAIAIEKNKLRMQIFEIRKERGKVGVEMKCARDEFGKSKDKMNKIENVYKEMLSLKNNDVDEGGLQADIISQIETNIEKSLRKRKTLQLLEYINDKLGDK